MSLAHSMHESRELALQIPTWAKAMGYRQATCSQLARMSALPILHFSGAQFAVKELSDATALEVRIILLWSALPGQERVAECIFNLTIREVGPPQVWCHSISADMSGCNPLHVQVKAPTGLHFSEEADEQEYWRARLLQPTGLAAYTEQQACMESQNPPEALTGQPDQSAAAAGEGGLASSAKVLEEAAAVKREPTEELTTAVRGMTAVGSLGRVKVPKAGFKQ